jgi:hypothetical protein
MVKFDSSDRLGRNLRLASYVHDHVDTVVAATAKIWC